MSTVYEKGMGYVNSRTGIIMLFVLSLPMIILPLVFLINNYNKITPVLIGCSIYNTLVGLFGMIVACIRAKRWIRRNAINEKS